MPTYAYRCPSCDHQFERFHKMSLTRRPPCPECRVTAERVITGGAGLVFKGSGFYVTDYKQAGAAETAAGDGAGEKAQPEGGKAKDAKPAKASEAAAKKKPGDAS